MLGKKSYLSGFLPQVSWAGLAVGLRGSAEVPAYFSLACSLLRTTLRFLLQMVGSPLRFVRLCTFGRHANMFPRLGGIPSPADFTSRASENPTWRTGLAPTQFTIHGCLRNQSSGGKIRPQMLSCSASLIAQTRGRSGSR